MKMIALTLAALAVLAAGCKGDDKTHTVLQKRVVNGTYFVDCITGVAKNAQGKPVYTLDKRPVTKEVWDRTDVGQAC